MQNKLSAMLIYGKFNNKHILSKVDGQFLGSVNCIGFWWLPGMNSKELSDSKQEI